jgi:hypothetical protein
MGDIFVIEMPSIFVFTLTPKDPARASYFPVCGVLIAITTFQRGNPADRLGTSLFTNHRQQVVIGYASRPLSNLKFFGWLPLVSNTTWVSAICENPKVG